MKTVGATGRSPVLNKISENYNRRSIRLKKYDYSSPGAYFVTICSNNQECIFGEITDSNGICSVYLSDYGEVVEDEWLKSTEIRKEINLDHFVIMPNHFHGIILVSKGDRPVAPTSSGPRSGSVSAMIAGFKSAVTKRINILRNSSGIPVWQRNYYERVIRNEDELNVLREYINYNPLNWETDDEYVR